MVPTSKSKEPMSWTGPSDGPETGCLVGWVGEGASSLQEEPASWGEGFIEPEPTKVVFLLESSV
jgi:hypothetical protein